jgi:hypothetical protein
MGAILAVLASCKDAGTIELQLGGDGGIACAGGSEPPRDAGPDADVGADYAIVLAEPASCDACTCGRCFGKAGERHDLGCSQDHRCGLDELAGLRLALDPGHWAVILELFAGDGALRATECADVEVDVDGVADKAISGMGLRCWADCDQGHRAAPGAITRTASVASGRAEPGTPGPTDEQRGAP